MRVPHSSLFGLIVAFGNLGIVRARLHGHGDDGVADDGPPSASSLAAVATNDDPLLENDGGDAGISLIAMQFTEDPHAGRDPVEMIIGGDLRLAAIRYSPNSFAANKNAAGDDDDGNYSDVHGEFCDYDPSLNKRDPAGLPTTHAIASASEHCGEHARTLPLREVMEAVRDHDSSSEGGGDGNGKRTMRSLPVSGMLFHEGHSGAGLVSNAISSAFDSALVVSEHPALRDALGACDAVRNRYGIDECSSAMRMRLVEDVVALLSRTPSDSPLRGLYLKLPSSSAAYLPDLRAMYPDAPWTYSYRRDAGHALAKATKDKRLKACGRARRNPTSALSTKSAESGVDLESLSHLEICAIHLSSLLDVAAGERARSGTGMLVSYDDDVNVPGGADFLVDVVLPYLGLGEEIVRDPVLARNRVRDVLSLRSDASGRHGMTRDGRRWVGEDIDVSEEVGAASRAFMKDSMDSIVRMR
mmetsp:Transcript_31445/g.76036  ORF Transcript_31445/g.76036 Transcript_31445/m.76036 type:complete len:471 (+) Transcript_31445:100-1512(+)